MKRSMRYGIKRILSLLRNRPGIPAAVSINYLTNLQVKANSFLLVGFRYFPKSTSSYPYVFNELTKEINQKLLHDSIMVFLSRIRGEEEIIPSNCPVLAKWHCKPYKSITPKRLYNLDK